MPRSATRARNRRARIEGQIVVRGSRVEKARTVSERVAAMDQLVRLSRTIAESNFRLWSFEALLTGVMPDAGATKAMIAQLVAPHLACNPLRNFFNDIRRSAHRTTD